MPVNDPVGDMLTRIRNASRARHDKVVHAHLEAQGRRSPGCSRSRATSPDYTEHDTAAAGRDHRAAQVRPGQEPGDHRHPPDQQAGLRRYVPVRDIRPVLGGLGISILSTSQGILSDADARKRTSAAS